jgi:hypothetical protein
MGYLRLELNAQPGFEHISQPLSSAYLPLCRLLTGENGTISYVPPIWTLLHVPRSTKYSALSRGLTSSMDVYLARL